MGRILAHRRFARCEAQVKSAIAAGAAAGRPHRCRERYPALAAKWIVAGPQVPLNVPVTAWENVIVPLALLGVPNRPLIAIVVTVVWPETEWLDFRPLTAILPDPDTGTAAPTWTTEPPVYGFTPGRKPPAPKQPKLP
jgi:hypothetical protein